MEARTTLLILTICIQISFQAPTENECKSTLRIGNNKTICDTQQKRLIQQNKTEKGDKVATILEHDTTIINKETATTKGKGKVKRSLKPLTSGEMLTIKGDLQKLLKESGHEITPFKYTEKDGIILMSQGKKQLHRNRLSGTGSRPPNRPAVRPSNSNSKQKGTDELEREVDVRKLKSLPKDTAFLSFPFILVG